MSASEESAVSSSGRQFPYALRAFRHRNFCLFFLGQFVSRVGYWMQGMAQGWLVYRLTESSFMLGMVSFAGQIPAVVLGLFAGVVADRFNRYRICMTTQTLFMIQALVLGFRTIYGHITEWEVFALALAAGILQTFEMPARQSFLQDIVGREDLTSAIALNSALVNAARILGPTFAGIIVAHSGEGECFTINGICYLAIIGGFFAMRLPPQPEARLAIVSTSTFIREGVSYAMHTPAVRLLLSFMGVLSLLSTPYTVLMPVFAKDILHRGADGMGLLMGAAGVGAVVSTIFLARNRDPNKLGRTIVTSLIRFGVGLILFSLSRNFWISMLLLPLVGSGFMLPMSAANTLLQTLTPDRLRGRVMSFFLMMVMGTPPLASLLSGVGASHLGAPLIVGITGVCCLASAIWFALRMHVLENVAGADEEEPAETLREEAVGSGR
ncbi:MAG: MFS transporter [Deltaproteobacteria bacterium]|nr:MFS transporter [Deltaproteobacteria bacterium]